jgi:hypothetical protein
MPDSKLENRVATDGILLTRGIHLVPPLPHEGLSHRLRLVFRRLTSGYYRRPDVIRAVAVKLIQNPTQLTPNDLDEGPYG